MKTTFDTPKCFETRHQMDQWRHTAKFVNEVSRICDDCSLSYEAQMRAKDRCEKAQWTAVIFGSRSAVGAYRRIEARAAASAKKSPKPQEALA